jgi:C1A family cysteine protease
VLRRGTGLLKQLDDGRDYQFNKYVKISGTVPEEHIIPFNPRVRNQGTLNSCTGFAVAKLVEYHLAKHGNTGVDVSPLFLWHNGKKLHNWADKNNGVWLRNSLKALLNNGFVYEINHPYTKDYYREPDSYSQALATVTVDFYFQRWISYLLLSKEDVIGCLAGDSPVVFGIYVNNSFYANRTGIIKDIQASRESHAMFAYGYKMIDGVQHIVCANSWGTGVGDRGIYYIPTSYFNKHAHDIWTLTELSENRKNRIIFNIN